MTRVLRSLRIHCYDGRLGPLDLVVGEGAPAPPGVKPIGRPSRPDVRPGRKPLARSGAKAARPPARFDQGRERASSVVSTTGRAASDSIAAQRAEGNGGEAGSHRLAAVAAG